MKKLLAFTLLLVYSVISTGFVVSVRYCMNKLDCVELGATQSDTCGKCGMKVVDSDGCCKDEVKIVKLDLDQLFAKLLQPNFALASAVALPVAGFHAEPMFAAPSLLPRAHGPPLPTNDLCLFNCVFRI